MIKRTKYEEFKYRRDLADECWIKAEIAFEEDRKAAAWKHMRNMYYQLLLAAEAHYVPPRSEKQKRQQKLWQQRGLLERTLANLRAIQKEHDTRSWTKWEAQAITNAVSFITMLISDNQYKMKTL